MSQCSAWSCALSLCLILLSMGDIFFSLTLLSTKSNFLYFANTHICTASGLIASLVTLPTAIKYYSTQSQDPKSGTENKSDQLTYLKLLIIVCTGLHALTTAITFISMGYSSNIKSAFTDSMRRYQNKYGSKVIVDQIQMNLQCCGMASYEDWFKIDWTGSAVILDKELIKDQTVREALKDGTETEQPSYLDEGVRWDTVPFSCCKISTDEPCIHKDLEQLGTTTINTKGCGKDILGHALAIFIAEFGINAILLIMLLILCIPTSKCFWRKKGKDRYTQFCTRSPRRKKNETAPNKSKYKQNTPTKETKRSFALSDSDASDKSDKPSATDRRRPIKPSNKPKEKHRQKSSRPSPRKQSTKSGVTSESSTNDETVALWMNYKPYTSSHTAQIKPTSHEEHLLRNERK